MSDQASYPVGTMSSSATAASRRGSVASFADQCNFGASSMMMPNYFYSGATLHPPPPQQANVTYHVPGAYSGEEFITFIFSCGEAVRS